jgi:hypothetical protein
MLAPCYARSFLKDIVTPENIENTTCMGQVLKTEVNAIMSSRNFDYYFA